MPSNRIIPITPNKLTGDVLVYERRYLDGADLAEWAEALIGARRRAANSYPAA